MSGNRALMIAGTGSDVGKSLIVAGLARVFSRRGLRVLPFKPQNMSNNAAVTRDGGEIGRAQALQARAAGVAPSVHMNPVLLKPQSETGSQVVVLGKVRGNYKAAEFQKLKPNLASVVQSSFESLLDASDLVLVEGAGSPAEINLRRGDIANMGFARAAGVPVVLVGDIDRGGVIASLVGTKHVLEPGDADMICGFIVNKFRGDPSLFVEGMAQISQRTGWASLGLVPYFQDAAKLPAEDAVVLGNASRKSRANVDRVTICVLKLPHISNFDDFDPLEAEPNVDLVYVSPGSAIPGNAKLVILPGSKAVVSDMAVLVDTGWDIDIRSHVRRGGHVLGICGGFQMLGSRISDPDGLEGTIKDIAGLGLLDIETTLSGDKSLELVQGTLAGGPGVAWSGFEMHMGRTSGAGLTQAFLKMADGRSDGARGAHGLVAGCYVHGLFAGNDMRRAVLEQIGAQPSTLDYDAQVDATLDALADHLETHVDCDALLELARVSPREKSASIANE